MAHKIIALHGFLGKPSDFRPLGLENLIAPSIFLLPPEALSSWAKRFNSTLKGGSILMGYSLGARLALHCLLDNPKLFRAAILIACHPGLKTSKEREQRLQNDAAWASRFLQEPWPLLMDAWNNLPALKTSKDLLRNERDFSRPMLAKCLRSYSLGQQNFLSPFLNELSLPILWLYGSLEEKNSEGINFKHPLSKKIAFKQGGHRFMFETPHLVREKIQKFLITLQGFGLA